MTICLKKIEYNWTLFICIQVAFNSNTNYHTNIYLPNDCASIYSNTYAKNCANSIQNILILWIRLQDFIFCKKKIIWNILKGTSQNCLYSVLWKIHWFNYTVHYMLFVQLPYFNESIFFSLLCLCDFFFINDVHILEICQTLIVCRGYFNLKFKV